MSISSEISEQINRIEAELKENRRYIHMHPELSFREYNTSSFIQKKLDEMGIKYVSGIAENGICAYIYGNKNIESESMKSILIRADMDALPIDEVSDKPYKSQNKNVMHACGHDAHVAVLLGVCKVLNNFKDKFGGVVKAVFQPGEETSGGALPMIEEGVLENPHTDVCVALHCDSDLDCGTIRVKPGSLYASPDDFRITVKGKGGHGAEPHNCIDPIMISASIIQALNNLISRETDPFDNAVISVGSIHGGSATNIIPDSVEIQGTARSLTNEVRGFLKRRIGETAEGICKTFGAECEYEYTELFPPLINDEKLAEDVYDSACRSIGKDKCVWGGAPTMAGEDFSYFSQNRPSVLFKLGCRNKSLGIVSPIHHSSFDIDENCLKTGVKVFVGFVLDYLN
ncbi:MAG: M20 family metallopeptidase [Eubacteriales bacterium]|nr:M20 family metallopeptidase [Eubacteriales bacterium]